VLRQRIDDSGESMREVIARPAKESDPTAVLPGYNPEPILLDFVQP
jgi:hypothetical protein